VLLDKPRALPDSQKRKYVADWQNIIARTRNAIPSLLKKRASDQITDKYFQDCLAGNFGPSCKKDYETKQKNGVKIYDNLSFSSEVISDQEKGEILADICALIDISRVAKMAEQNSLCPCDPLVLSIAEEADKVLAGDPGSVFVVGSGVSAFCWSQWYNSDSGTLMLTDLHPFAARYQQRMIEWWKTDNIVVNDCDFLESGLPEQSIKVLFTIDFFCQHQEEKQINDYFKIARRLLSPGGCLIIAESNKSFVNLYAWIEKAAKGSGFSMDSHIEPLIRTNRTKIRFEPAKA
jgi:hypothetical protein